MISPKFPRYTEDAELETVFWITIRWVLESGPRRWPGKLGDWPKLRQITPVGRGEIIIASNATLWKWAGFIKDVSVSQLLKMKNAYVSKNFINLQRACTY